MGLFSNLPFLKRNQAEAAPVPATPVAPASTEVAIELTAAAETVAPAPSAVAISSETRAQAEAIVRNVVQELPDFMAVAVLDSISGHILAGQWAGHSGGAKEAAAAHAEIVQQARLAIEALQVGPDELLEDILITLRQQLHLLRVLPAQNWLLYLAVRTQDTNLALARAVLRTMAT